MLSLNYIVRVVLLNDVKVDESELKHRSMKLIVLSQLVIAFFVLEENLKEAGKILTVLRIRQAFVEIAKHIKYPREQIATDLGVAQSCNKRTNKLVEELYHNS